MTPLLWKDRFCAARTAAPQAELRRGVVSAGESGEEEPANARSAPVRACAPQSLRNLELET